MLELNKLEIFSVVVDEGSFSAAAERLHISQPAVSQHMKELEASLGQQLFRRGWRGVSLTEHGQVLADYAHKILALVAEAQNAVGGVGALTSGRVSLGATPGIGIYLVPGWVSRFRMRYPQLTTVLQTGVTARIITDVLAHRLDIGAIEGELDDFHQARLSALELEEIEQMVVVGRNHLAWGAKAMQPEDLHQQPLIVREQNSQTRIWLERALKAQNLEPRIVAEFDNIESMKRAVLSGTCMTILPPYVISNEVETGLLQAIPVEGRPFVRSLKLVWDRDVRFSPATRAFLAELSKTYPVLEAHIDMKHEDI